MTAKAYTIRYTDDLGQQRDFCTYAKDAYDARITALEMVQTLHDHPNRINHILLEPEKFDW